MRTSYLQDPALSPQELAQHLGRVGAKPLSEAIELTAGGSALISDVENDGIARLDPAGQFLTLVRSPAIACADGVAVALGDAVCLPTGASPATSISCCGRLPASAWREDGTIASTSSTCRPSRPGLAAHEG